MSRITSVIAALFLTLCLVVASRGNVNAQARPEVGTLRVGIIPIASLTPIYVAEKLGFFEQEGLKVERKVIATSPDMLAAMAGGSIEVAYANVVTLVFARVQGFDFVIVSSHTRAHETPPDNGGLVVKKDSPIRDLKQLEGKRLATNSLKDYNYIMNRAFLEKRGVNSDRVEWAEARFPHMGPTLLKGEVDVAHMVEPFLTMFIQAGDGRVLAWPNVEIYPGIEIAPFIASTRWLKAHPIAARKFVAALSKANEYLNKNRAERINYVAEFTKMKSELVEKMTIDVWRTKVDPGGVKFLIDRMVKEKLIDKPVSVDELIYETAK